MPDERLELVGQKARNWARALVDFGPYNTLLYCTERRSNLVDLGSADPAEMEKLLSGRSSRLSNLLLESTQLTSALKQLRSLKRRIMLASEEQGLELGRLTRGIFHVDPPVQATAGKELGALQAPLLLHSIKIEGHATNESDYSLVVDTNFEINPVLLIALRDHHGCDIDVDTVADELGKAADKAATTLEQTSSVASALSHILAQQGRSTRLEDRVLIGTFAFDKLPMMQDLLASTELLARHDVVAAAAGDQDAIKTLRDQASSRTSSAPDNIIPGNELLVLDADSSQHDAIEAVLDGRHTVIQGPPGTGKSQTIANIISAGSATGKRILFFAEKRAAIDSVVEYLEQVGLSGLVLDLHGQHSRRDVANQIGSSLSSLESSAPPPGTDSLHTRLSATREKLIRMARDMYLPRDPWGVSARELYRDLIAIPAELQTSRRIPARPLSSLDRSTFESRCDDLNLYINSDGLRLRRGDSAWSDAELREDQIDTILIQLEMATSQSWKGNLRAIEAIVSAVGVREPTNLAKWTEVLELFENVVETLRIYDSQVFDEDLYALSSAICPPERKSECPTKNGLFRRFRLRRKARSLRRSADVSRETMYEELRAIMAQRQLWREVAIDPDAKPCAIELEEEKENFVQLRNNIVGLALSARIHEPESLPINDLNSSIERLQLERETVFVLPELSRLAERFNSDGLDHVLDEIAQRDLDTAAARSLLRSAWCASLLDRFRVETPALASFGSQQQDDMIKLFRELDAQHFHVNARRVRSAVSENLRQTAREFPAEHTLDVPRP